MTGVPPQAFGQTERGSIQGRVTDSSNAVLQGASVTLMPGGMRAVTNTEGEYAIGGLAPGTDYPVFATRFGKVGMMVCYDGFFPEVARALSSGGAEVIAWPVWGCNPLLASARACENHVYLVSSTYETRYGRVVKIQHANGFMTVYAHNDDNVVELGDRVVLGQIIASVGRTGRATNHHVHFEIRHSGFAYNPLYMLPLPPRLTQLVEAEDEESDEADE